MTQTFGRNNMTTTANRLSYTVAMVLAALLFAGCGTVWIQEPPVTAADGSKIVTTAFHKQYRRDSLRIDRTRQDGSKSYWILPRLPKEYDDYSVVRATNKSVTIRLLDDAGALLDEFVVPYSQFSPRPTSN